MNQFTRTAIASVASALGVGIAIAILQSAHVPFPPALSWDAWAQWAVFGAVVHASIGLTMRTANRVFRGAPPKTPSGSQPAA